MDIIFPYKTEKNRAFPGQPHGKTEIFHQNYNFSTLNGQKGEKIPFWPFFADLAPTVADEVVLRGAEPALPNSRRPLAAQIDLSKNE